MNEALELPFVPEIVKLTHMSADISWQDELEKYLRSRERTVGRNVLSELSMRKEGTVDWTSIYSGYDVHYLKKDLQPDTIYYFRLRLENMDGQGPWSKEAVGRTAKAPMTGFDIHRALKQGNPSLLREILGKEEAYLEAPDNLGFTPLMYCAQRNLQDMMEVLLDWNADPNTQDSTGKTALMFAAFKGNIECIETLLDCGSDVNITDQNDLTALHMAVDGEQPRAIRLLVKSGANLEAREVGMKWTPLLRCAGLKNNGNVEVAHELVRLGAEIDAADEDGKTALHNAILNGHHDLCDFLIKHGASLELVTRTNHNAVQLAESFGNRKVLQVIQEALKQLSEDKTHLTPE
ncbi:Fibronectin type 3 and ankyrin repeat domains protein 1 [Clonorchis sinensis]|uniref:Fibronectin type 3 and ankyrin repeat domains protein 1 n=2 Tax=Clonorchis sinensis TaxID=79923 RepID=A0A8T1MA93_CLOSI|nr:Fibronectin type 3 and ankyrin repeat domains protein 1 [Clonorchis sinensis]